MKSNKEQVLSFFGKGGINEEAYKELRKEMNRASKRGLKRLKHYQIENDLL